MSAEDEEDDVKNCLKIRDIPEELLVASRYLFDFPGC